MGCRSGRLTSVTLKNSSHTTLRTESYTYQNNSNVATHVVDSVTTTYGYDDIDQLTSEARTGYSASYTYDANGNRLTRTVGGSTENYTYDDADKLDYIEIGGVTVKDYGYDAAGRTTSVVSSAGTTTLSWSYDNRLTGITYPNTSTNSFGLYVDPAPDPSLSGEGGKIGARERGACTFREAR